MLKSSSFRLALLVLSLGAISDLIAATIVFKIRRKPPGSGPIFLAVNINGWNPKNLAFGTVNDSISIQATIGTTIEYKFTLGTWETVELQADGSDMPNRTLMVNGDSTIWVDIAQWKKPGSKKPKKSTACKHVQLLDSALFIPQLNRYRSVRVHLPPDYFTSKKRYPVLYLNDGQNCFDDVRAAFMEWKIDEAMDSLYKATGWSAIVIAIDHGGDKRLTEYNINNHPRFGQQEGSAYLQFVAETLKPMVDKKYRTLSGRKYTWMAGSSMGGLISTAVLVNQGKQFGGAGIFSPAYWTSAPDIFKQVSQYNFESPTYAFVYMGGKEGESMEPDARRMYDIFNRKSEVKVKLTVDPNGVHREWVWAHYFHPFLLFMKASVGAGH